MWKEARGVCEDAEADASVTLCECQAHGEQRAYDARSVIYSVGDRRKEVVNGSTDAYSEHVRECGACEAEVPKCELAESGAGMPKCVYSKERASGGIWNGQCVMHGGQEKSVDSVGPVRAKAYSSGEESVL